MHCHDVMTGMLELAVTCVLLLLLLLLPAHHVQACWWPCAALPD
jgi:hypothetical protein